METKQLNGPGNYRELRETGPRFGKSKFPGALQLLNQTFPENIASSRLVALGSPRMLQLELFSNSQSKENESSHCVTIDFNISNRSTYQWYCTWAYIYTVTRHSHWLLLSNKLIEWQLVTFSLHSTNFADSGWQSHSSAQGGILY